MYLGCHACHRFTVIRPGEGRRHHKNCGDNEQGCLEPARSARATLPGFARTSFGCWGHGVSLFVGCLFSWDVSFRGRLMDVRFILL